MLPEKDKIRADDHLVSQIKHGLLSDVPWQAGNLHLAEMFERAVVCDLGLFAGVGATHCKLRKIIQKKSALGLVGH